MTTDEMHDIMNENDGEEFLKFDRVENKRSQRPDLHAFLLIDELAPATRNGQDMVSAAEHDEIYLSVSPERLAAVATREQVIELSRCGVRYDEGIDSLCMFV